MSADTNAETNAGFVAPSDIRYEVTYTHEHPTIALGDVVKVIGYGGYHAAFPLLLRIKDLTLHSLWGRGEQYVHLRPVEENP